MRHKFLPFFDAILVQISFFSCAWLLRIEFNPVGAPLVYAAFMSLFAYIVGMYGIAVRYAGVALLKSAAVGAACGFTALAGIYGLELVGYFAFSSLVSVCAVICSRVIVREYLFQSRHENASNTLVYGAGDAGIQFVTAAMQGDKFNVLGYIDDDNERVGSSIHGRLVSPSKDLSHLIDKLRIRTVVLALPSLTRTQRKSIIEGLISFPVRVVTVPSLNDIVDGVSKITDTQEVPVEDLLGRDPVPPNAELLAAKITGKTILVTGAGGSIGSELCRQIAQLKPSKLVLLENSEPSLYQVEQELLKRSDIELHAVLGSVCDKHVLKTLFRTHEINAVFHAAAYKHVPMVEANPLAALVNNVSGTELVLRSAIDSGCSSFTLISTDKAVRPTNIMGATKRLAEMVCQAVAEEEHRTTISMVRFGNVLGSSGSVIPTFRAQIAAGGPVTVTHEEITRYFMTIPEAAQLVIQSASLAEGGDVFILDMGEPIKIYDLAERLIRLSGKELCEIGQGVGSSCVEIKVTGLRPGEKLYEELLVDSSALPTEHEKICRAVEPLQPFAKLANAVGNIKDALKKGDLGRAKNLLVEIGTGYQQT